MTDEHDALIAALGRIEDALGVVALAILTTSVTGSSKRQELEARVLSFLQDQFRRHN